MANFIIKRPEYLQQLLAYQDTDLVKIVTGIRCCGKSTPMELMVEKLKRQEIAEDHIIHMNMESLKYHDMLEYLSLHQYITAQMKATGKYYLFLMKSKRFPVGRRLLSLSGWIMMWIST